MSKQFHNLIIYLALPIVLAVFATTGCKKKTLGPPVDIPLVRLQEGATLQSKLTGLTLKYSVLLPADYKTSGVSYPVVYLLHGYGDNYTAWAKGGNIQLLSDNLGSEIVPMIYVMPDGFNLYYMNNHNGTNRYMDMFVSELVPEIDRIYRTKKDAGQRAVMGYSMGGYGALILPAKNQNVFKVSVPLSMSFRTDEQYMAEPQGVFNTQWAPVFGGSGSTGTARLTEYFKQNSPFHFFDKSDLSAFTGFKLYFDCGDDEESLSVTSGALHNLLRDRNFPHEFRMDNGAHTWNYWYRAVPLGLKFISKAFEGIAYPTEPTAVAIGTSIADNQYVLETLQSTSLQFGVFKPSTYNNTTDKYPVIFFINDSDEPNRKPNAIKLISFLNNSMQAGKIPQSVIVEIPYGTSGINATTFFSMVDQIKTNHRIVTGKESRVLIGSGKGAMNAWSLMPDNKSLVKSCFLFDATLPDNASGTTDAFYYVDVTDKASGYKGNHSLYVDLRSKSVNHEYRVRQGTPGFQSFINGLDASWYYLSKQLKNQ